MTWGADGRKNEIHRKTMLTGNIILAYNSRLA
jgi:hypothetical protein